MSKGSSQAAQKQVGIDNSYASAYNQNANNANSQLFPFLTGEMTNPQGFGDQAVTAMKTEGGEAAAGGLGQATEAASLLGSRTGNTAATPGIIDAASRNAMKVQADNARKVDLANANAKLGQQQEGARGLGGLYGEDVNAALHSLGLADESINAWTNARAHTFPSEFANAYAIDLAKGLTTPPGAGGASD